MKQREFQRSIQNPIEYLRWSFCKKVVNGSNPLTTFVKGSILDVRLRSEYIYYCYHYYYYYYYYFYYCYCYYTHIVIIYYYFKNQQKIKRC